MKKNYPKKVNLHILEACNYSCKHCFSHFNAKTADIDDWKVI